MVDYPYLIKVDEVTNNFLKREYPELWKIMMSVEPYSSVEPPVPGDADPDLYDPNAGEEEEDN